MDQILRPPPADTGPPPADPAAAGTAARGRGRRAAGAGLLLVALTVLLLTVPAGSPRARRPPVPATPPAPTTLGAPRSTPPPGTPGVVGTRADRTNAPFTGYRVPDFTLHDLAGQSVHLSAYHGHPVWINEWATWCPPCRAEMPEIQQLYARYQAQGLVVLGVDFREDRETVRDFVHSSGFSWTFLLDSQAGVAARYAVTGLPLHAFVDQTGIIRAIMVGGFRLGMESYLAEILAL